MAGGLRLHRDRVPGILRPAEALSKPAISPTESLEVPSGRNPPNFGKLRHSLLCSHTIRAFATEITAKEDAVRVWPWRDAKLTKAVHDQATCINMSRRR